MNISLPCAIFSTTREFKLHSARQNKW